MLTILIIPLLCARMDLLIMGVIQQSGSESSNNEQTEATLKLIRCNLADLVIAHKLEKQAQICSSFYEIWSLE